MAKLTLSVEKDTISRAKRYAKREGVSISEMVETYLAEVAGRAGRMRETPILRSVRGVLKRADVEEYRKHLAKKYQ